MEIKLKIHLLLVLCGLQMLIICSESFYILLIHSDKFRGLSLSVGGDWNEMIFKVSSNPDHWVILWSLCSSWGFALQAPWDDDLFFEPEGAWPGRTVGVLLCKSCAQAVPEQRHNRSKMCLKIRSCGVCFEQTNQEKQQLLIWLWIIISDCFCKRFLNGIWQCH